MDAIGRKHWAIAEGYIPSQSSFLDHALISHETACILNAGGSDAHVALTIFFTDRDPVGPYRITVPARRTLHLRFNDLTEPSPIPRDTDFSSVFDSDVPIVVQHTRLNLRHAEVSLMSTTAYSEFYSLHSGRIPFLRRSRASACVRRQTNGQSRREWS